MRAMRWLIGRAALALIGAGAPVAGALAQIDVISERYDDARLGANLQETQLTTANVNAATFGKLWSYTVSGSVYAQPLYVRDVAIPGRGTHNVLYVATMNDVVYAFDADSSEDAPLLTANLLDQVPGSTPVPIRDFINPPDVNIVGNMGIESTPVIDLASGTMYLVAQTKEADGSCGTLRNGRYCHRLHALDIATLEEKFGGPVLIEGSIPGSGAGNVGGTLTFDALLEDQRSSLALANGRIFMSWSSHEDQGSYHGWIMSYDAATLQQTSLWMTTPNGDRGGVWMAGRAPAVDAEGNVYYMTGNGSYDGVTEWGESFLKFSSAPQFAVLDWFTPNIWDSVLNAADLDLGGSGPMLIPGTNLIVGGGKGGWFYVTHTAAGGMGQENDPDLIVQSFSNGGQQIKGGPVYWNRDGGLGPWMYVWGENRSPMKAYRFDAAAGAFDTTPVSEGSILSASASGSGVLTLSANGSTPGSGIVWASIALPGTGNPNGGVHPGALRAFDADDLTVELWNSTLDADDDSGNWPKFSPPTVVNGRVYLASFPLDGIADAPLNVYGLFEPPDFTLEATPADATVAAGGSVAYTVDTTASGGFADPVHLEVSGLPANATATFAANDVAAPGTTTLTVQTAVGTTLGATTLTITGSSGALTRTASVGLEVTVGDRLFADGFETPE